MVVWLFFFYFEGRNNVSDEMVCDSVVCSIDCIVIYCKVKVERDVYIGIENLEFHESWLIISSADLPPVKIRYFEKFQFFNILIEKNEKIFKS